MAVWAIVLVLSFLWVSPAHAQEKSEEVNQILERWKCYDSSFAKKYDKKNVLLEARRIKFQKREFGEIESSGITKITRFRIHGLNRAWFWKSDDNDVFGFIIDIKKRGVYVDSELKQPTFFYCDKK